eukprot:TRINITY_DN2305_c0_g2_i1.p1 TRINITY_DN2305_c0_g2~~TRINITY_DN2305_c0_g2_i1.p1  ORF type:complete len:127 (+),score=9.78 TRINITY_DN2305_c0_g2_i1:107-487(+)
MFLHACPQLSPVFGLWVRLRSTRFSNPLISMQTGTDEEAETYPTSPGDIPEVLSSPTMKDVPSSTVAGSGKAPSTELFQHLSDKVAIRANIAITATIRIPKFADTNCQAPSFDTCLQVSRMDRTVP